MLQTLPASWRLARNTLAGKRGRTALMIGAVALAAALVMAVACSVASVQSAMELGITRFVGATDARIVHQGNGRFSEDLLSQVRTWPEVEVAAGRLGASVTLVHADQKRDQKTGDLLRMTPHALGVDYELEPSFRVRELSVGRIPQAPDEIIIDPMTAEQLQVSLGDVLEVQRFGDPIALRVVGIFERPRLAAVQRPLIEIDRRVLAEAADRPSQLTSVVIKLKADVGRGPEAHEHSATVEAFCAKYQSDLPAILSLEPAERVRAGFNKQIEASRFGFIIAAMVTFICASFIIVTALTTSVTERQREMAVTRCLGASRGHLFFSQLIAGAFVSCGGAIVGIPLGILLTALLAWLFKEHLSAGLTVPAIAFWLAGIGSIGAGTIGALYPAWMASRVSPLQAMSYRAKPPRASSMIFCVVGGLLLIGLQLALRSFEDTSDRFFAYAYLGLPALLLGYFILAIPMLLVVANALGPAISTIVRLPAGMLKRTVLATPFRHGFTAGSLMVGIAILVSTWSNMTSLLQDWVGQIKFADGFAFKITGIAPDEQRAIANLPFVIDHCPISYLPLRVYGRQVFGVQGLAPPNVTCMGFDPDKFFAMNAVEWAAGNPQEAIARLKDGTGLIVADRFLVTQKVQVGDTMTLGVGKVRKAFTVVGAVSSAGLDIATQAFGIRSQYMEYSVSCVFMDWKTVNETFDNRDAHIMQLNIDEELLQREIAAASQDATKADEFVIRAIAEAAPGVQYYSGKWIRKTIDDVAVAIHVVNSTMAFAALVLASLGVGNVILANIHSRRYEFGVLRAIGGQKQLIARLILAEAAILAITGAMIGTLLGIHLAWMGANHYRELGGLPVRLTLPQVPTATGWLVVIALTLLAAIPAVRAIVKQQPSALLAAGRNG